jgi:hypothetical protein
LQHFGEVLQVPGKLRAMEALGSRGSAMWVPQRESKTGLLDDPLPRPRKWSAASFSSTAPIGTMP